MSTNTQTSTKALLRCGIFVAPVFYGIASIQLLLERDFDIRRLPISFLSLGDLGWLQNTSFVTCGLLAAAFSVGLRRVIRKQRAGTWGPTLIGIYAVGMMMAGFFHPDPAYGFPAGAPAGMPAKMTLHATLHMAAFFIAFTALIASSFVFARRFASVQDRRWAVYSAASGVFGPILIVAGSLVQNWSGLIIALAGLVLFGWLSLLGLPWTRAWSSAAPRFSRNADGNTLPISPN